MESKLSFKQIIILMLVAALLLLTVTHIKETLGILGALFSYILPLFAGACIAFAINVPMKAFERLLAFIQRHMRMKVRHTFNTYVSLILTFAAVVGLAIAFVNVMAPEISKSVNSVVAAVEAWYPRAIEQIKAWGYDTSSIEELFKDFEFRKIIDAIGDYFTFTPDSVAGTIDTVISAASMTVSAIITVFSTLIFSIYMLTNKKKLNLQTRKLIYAYFPQNTADYLTKVGSLIYKTFYSFISSQCLEAVILATLLSLVMLVLNLPYSGVICLLTCVLALVPYIGAFVACAIGGLLILIVSPAKALVFVIAYLVVQQIEEQLIYPHVVGGSIGLPPLWTLFAALVGGKLLGVFGVICFIPLTAVVYTLIKESAASRLHKKGITVECPVDTEEREKQRLHDERRLKRKRKKLKKDK